MLRILRNPLRFITCCDEHAVRGLATPLPSAVFHPAKECHLPPSCGQIGKVTHAAVDEYTITKATTDSCAGILACDGLFKQM